MKGKSKRSKINLGFPSICLLCFIFLLVGFYASSILSHDVPRIRPRLRMLELDEEKEGQERDWMMPNGDSGDSFFSKIPFQVLSWKPRALYFPSFATEEQCKTIVAMAKKRLRPSTLALRKGETEESTKGTRTSSGTFISGSEDESGTLGFIEEKIARATMIPRNHGEAFNILRYEIGQKYDSHYDAFNPAEYGQQTSQRPADHHGPISLSPLDMGEQGHCLQYFNVASFLLYLSDVEEGGETMFPFENGTGISSSYDYKQCVGLKVKPRRGDGLLFYSLFLNGTIDQLSLHGSCPVIKGEKWVATKWIRDQEQED